MMTLTNEQLAAAAAGKTVRFTMNGVEYVLARSELLTLNPNHDHEELRQMLAHAAAGSGWDEPGMEAYDSYPAKP